MRPETASQRGTKPGSEQEHAEEGRPDSERHLTDLVGHGH